MESKITDARQSEKKKEAIRAKREQNILDGHMQERAKQTRIPSVPRGGREW